MDRTEANRRIAETNAVIFQTGQYEKEGVLHFLQLSQKARQTALVFLPDAAECLRNEQGAKRGGLPAAAEVVEGDTMDHAASLVLNFASALHPGGGYLTGSPAQEECLCRESTLYESLTSEEAAPFYAYHAAHLLPADSNAMVLSPFVEIFRQSGRSGYEYLSKTRTTAVITAAAPDLFGRGALLSQEEIDRAMMERIESILALASAFGYRTITLGAWGCGVFGHDARRVSSYFHDALFHKKWATLFDHITFAICDPPEKGQYNLRAFQHQFENG